MARITEIHERLTRWQEWFFTSQAGGVKSPKLTPPVDRSPRLGGFVDFDESEALETDAAVAQLPDDLRKIVVTVYLDAEHRTMETTAKMLQVSRVTLYRKLELSDKILKDKFEKRVLIGEK